MLRNFKSDMQEEIMVKGVNSFEERGYFFNPWKSKELNLFGKKVLVIGASHNCPHSPKGQLPCAHFCECTNCSVSVGDSKKFNNTCPHLDSKTKIPDEDYCNLDDDKVLLEDTTIYEVKKFLENPSYKTNRTYYNFSSFMFEYFVNKCDTKMNKDKFFCYLWNHISFANCIQNFEAYKTGNNFSQSDLDSFKKYICLINPEVVIVWGSVGFFLERKKIKADAIDSDKYNWTQTINGHKINFLHSYHPSSPKYRDGGKLASAMDRIW